MKRLNFHKVGIIVLTLALIAETCWIVKENWKTTAVREEWAYSVDAELSANFETALSDGSIEVWFQPIVDADSGEAVGAEALSRWKDNDGYISPSVFISVLEETGQITDLDRNVFREACNFQKRRIDSGEEIIPLSVNLSVVTLMQEGIVDEYSQILEAAGVPAGAINVEVTETLDSDKLQVVNVAEAFHAAGFQIEIDDFGAGYASLGNLAVIPYDVLKIDKSLVDEIGTERGNLLITDVILMAKDFNMTVIAEGVETDGQALFLRDAECDAIQGYYYARPMSKEDFIEYLGK